MRFDLRFSIEAPDGTDPQRVLEVVNRELDSAADGGGLVQYGVWDYTAAEVVDPVADVIERRLPAIEARLQIGPMQPGETRYGETRYGEGGNSIHMHVASGPCPCGQHIPFCGVAGHPDGAHGGHPG